MSNNLQETITEAIERLVIEYGNLSGRESANRADFREKARSILQSVVERQHQADMEEVIRVAEKILTIDVESVEWEDESKKWKDGIEPCQECENAEKIRNLINTLKDKV